jgi:molecular chaperone GrpE
MRSTLLSTARRLHAAPALARVAWRAPAASRPPALPARGALLRALSTSASPGEASASDAAEEKPKEAAAEGDAAAGAEASAAGAEAGADAEAAEAEVDEVGDLKKRVAELEEEVSSKHDQVLRALAEAENARRRAKIDVDNAHKFAVGKFAKSLLDTADNLARAADSVPEELRTSDENPALRQLYDGVAMTDKQLHKTFEQYGMKKIWPLGEKFDPNLHDALFEMPNPDKEPGEVGHVANAGYVLHDRCVRPAGVGVVSKPPE